MATVDLIMPKMGESIMEATILKWHKQPGDSVKMDETVLEIATDKVDTEVPSTSEGVMEEILYKVNDVVPVGAVIARIKTSVEEDARHKVQGTGYKQEETRYKEQGTGYKQESSYKMQEEKHKPHEEYAEVESVSHTRETSSTQSSIGNGRFYSPLVLNIAASEGVSMSELERISGTGNEGRVTKKDILQYVSDRKAGR